MQRCPVTLRLIGVIHSARDMADDYDVKARTICEHLLEVGTLEWCLLVTPPSLMTAASIWLARSILGNYKWVGTCPHVHQMFFDSSHEDCKPRTLFLLRWECLASVPYREFDVKLHCKTHMTRAVSQKVYRETLAEGKHPRFHVVSDLYHV